jgi:hypothetical protein
MTRFHDLAFGNKLYAGRRRYITQYVARYPYPDPSSAAGQELVAVVKEIVQSVEGGTHKTRLSSVELRVNHLVQECFGVTLNGQGKEYARQGRDSADR